jgi:hypothetical protein
VPEEEDRLEDDLTESLPAADRHSVPPWWNEGANVFDSCEDPPPGEEDRAEGVVDRRSVSSGWRSRFHSLSGAAMSPFF